MDEARNTKYSVYLGGTKMYRDLKQTFWWNNMKRDIAEYVSKCLTCQKVKAEHQQPVGELRPSEIPTWKWDSNSIDFVIGLPLTASKKNAIWVIVGRLTKYVHLVAIRDSLTKSVHLVTIHDSWNVDKLAQIMLKK